MVHEYTHAVFGAKTGNKIFYYCKGVPQSVSEGYADIMACFADGDWRMAEEIADQKIGDGCMRNIGRPDLSGNPSKVRGKYYECSKRKYGSGTLSASNASVCLYLQGTEGMKRYTFHVPEGSGRYWSVYRYNSATKTIVPVNRIRR